MTAHLTNDEFFSRLGHLLASRREKAHGSVWLTQKPLTHDAAATETTTTSTPAPPPAQDAETLPDAPEPSPPCPPILVRATDGNSQHADRTKTHKIKLSTVVQPADIEAFYGRYAEVCKTGMTYLRKRDRSKRKKTAKKKKAAATATATGVSASQGEKK